MSPEANLHAEVEFALGDNKLGAWQLPRLRETTVGRSSSSGIRLLPDWAPRLLCTFVPTDEGWLLRNGARTRLVTESKWTRSAQFEPGALVMLQIGVWALTWQLDGCCSAEVHISHRPTARQLALPWPRGGLGGDQGLGTYVAADPERLRLSPEVRHKLAVLYRHEFSGERAPGNLCEAAAGPLGVTAAAVKVTAKRVQDRVNMHRQAQLTNLQDLGYYLVNVAYAITEDDLDTRGEGRPPTRR